MTAGSFTLQLKDIYSEEIKAVYTLTVNVVEACRVDEIELADEQSVPYDTDLISYILNDPDLSEDDQRITFGLPSLVQEPNCNEEFEHEVILPDAIEECFDVSERRDEFTFPSSQRSCDLPVGNYGI